MSKKPVPKKKRAKRATRLQHSHFIGQEVKRLRNRANSPYAGPAKPKSSAGKALKSITRVQA